MAEESFTYVGNLLPNLMKLIEVDSEHLKTFWGFEEQLNHIRESLAVLAHLVQHAEQKQDTVEHARWWLSCLKQVAYATDDLLSELAYEAARLQVPSFRSVSRSINNERKARLRLTMEPKLKKANNSLQYVLQESLSLELRSIPHDSEDMLFQYRDNHVVGRKADVAKIVNLLTGSSYQQLTVVSILGESGVGKTTVAKLVCQKVMALTKKLFDVKIWLCLPVNLSVQNILKEMLLALNASMEGLTNHVAILQQLKIELTSKKFLLVLDHVSNEKIGHWDIFKILLSGICTNNGNAILVTTRSQNVSLLMGVPSTSAYQLDSFSNDDCWFMGFNRDEEAWLNYGGLEGEPISLLNNNFHHLPSYLRPCFTFCSNFRKGFLFRKEELIWLWMAEAIVESFDMGNKCFDDLLAISLLQEAEIDKCDNIILCQMYMCRYGIFDDFKSRIRIDDMSYILHLYADQVFAYPQEDFPYKLRTLILSGAPNKKVWKRTRL